MSCPCPATPVKSSFAASPIIPFIFAERPEIIGVVKTELAVICGALIAWAPITFAFVILCLVILTTFCLEILSHQVLITNHPEKRPGKM